MRERGMSIGAGIMVFVAGLIVLTNAGVIGISWPWEKLDLPDVLTEETVIVQPDEATIYDIEAITLDCRARIHARVPVHGKRDHRVLGQTYRTDTVSMTAIGDIDTCVEASATEVIRRSDTEFRVLVPATAVTFERPRVDAVATMDSVEFDKGFVGKLTDVFPWVSDNTGLTPAAYGFAQDIVGSSACMEQAWDVTKLAIQRAYLDQMLAQGGTAADITVEVIGAPDFAAGTDAEQGGYVFDLSGGGVQCRVDAGAVEATVVDDSEVAAVGP